MELTHSMSRIVRIPLCLMIANLEIRCDAALLLLHAVLLHPYFIEISGAATASVPQLVVIYHC